MAHLVAAITEPREIHTVRPRRPRAVPGTYLKRQPVILDRYPAEPGPYRIYFYSHEPNEPPHVHER